MTMPRFEAKLPFPPTINHYYNPIKRGQLVISEQGKAFHDLVKIMLAHRATGETMTGDLAVAVEAWYPNRIKRDLDNLLKPLLDALQKVGIFKDDSQIVDLRIVKGGLAKPLGHVFVRVDTVEGGTLCEE